MRTELDRTGGAFGPAFDELKSIVLNVTGHARLSARDDLLFDKLTRRIDHNGLPSIAAYLDLLKCGASGKAEFDCLIAELTVGETSFFRHAEHFDALRDHVLPACLARNSGSRQLRIWSAGCANGAEAYSIAILVRGLLGAATGDWNVTIVGSDINCAFLAEAERGVYTDWALREVPDAQRSAFFARQGGNWAIRNRYKTNVRFVAHNLASGEFPCVHKNIVSFDIIMCRNVMIYFDQPNNAQLADRLKTVLVDGGWLFTGPTDFNPRLEQNFSLEKVAGALVYRNQPRRPAVTRQPVASPVPAKPARLAPTTHAAVPPRSRPRLSAVPKLGALTSQPSIDTIIALANQADWPAAARCCERLLAAEPCNAQAHYYHALVQQYSGADAAAEQALRRAIYLDANFALAHYQLGLLRKDTDDTEQSRRSFRNVLAALGRMPDDRPISPCGQITAFDLRELAARQLELLTSPTGDA